MKLMQIPDRDYIFDFDLFKLHKIITFLTANHKDSHVLIDSSFTTSVYYCKK